MRQTCARRWTRGGPARTDQNKAKPSGMRNVPEGFVSAKVHRKNTHFADRSSAAVWSARTQPKPAKAGRETHKRLKRAFSLPYISYNLHYTKYSHLQKGPFSFACALQIFGTRPRLAGLSLRGQEKSAPAPLCPAQVRDAQFCLVRFRSSCREPAAQPRSQMAP